MNIVSKLYSKIALFAHYRIVYAPGVDALYRYYQGLKIKQIRKKTQITVLFIIGEASTWKTESLYNAMLKHPRFKPILGITESLHVPGSKEILINYLAEKGYSYIDLDLKRNMISKIKPDIKFYYKPYELNYRHGIYFDYNLKSIVCSINYGFCVSGGSEAFKHNIKRYAWKEFLENYAIVDAIANVGKYTGNKVITGIPIQDILSLPKSSYRNPWKQCGAKKRIIYAPHHSIKGYNGNFIEYATFFEFGEFMLGMAKKYSDKVQWVFKPHPSLKSKLIKIWGVERTLSYYDEWEKLPNCQIELGAYNDIFAYSDAMIHDCSSFIVEYQYTHNPVLFLEEKHRTAEEMFLNEYGYDVYNAHYHASTKEQIENFIKDVINGKDPKAKERESVLKKYLQIPNNKTASENIIDVILGEK